MRVTILTVPLTRKSSRTGGIVPSACDGRGQSHYAVPAHDLWEAHPWQELLFMHGVRAEVWPWGCLTNEPPYARVAEKIDRGMEKS